jgi:hypothetical protein
MAKTVASKNSRAEALRDWNRILGLWRVCETAACHKARACRGNVRKCTPVNFARVPEGVQGWFCCLLAAKEEGLSFDQALAEIEKTSAAEAFHDWHASADAAA